MSLTTRGALVIRKQRKMRYCWKISVPPGSPDCIVQLGLTNAFYDHLGIQIDRSLMTPAFHCRSPSLQGHMRLASYVPGELIPLPLSGSIPELPHVAKVVLEKANNSEARRRIFRVEIRGTSSPHAKIMGEVGNATEVIRIVDRSAS
jgi:hypothetical protein